MKPMDQKLSPDEIAAAKARRLEAMHLQAIEGNPLDAEDIAMFEMFERKGWSHEQCRTYMLQQAQKSSSLDAAE
jgi:hypothetical protein